jgi:phosphatidylglycerol:prolipoprotein diacylglycerol transferase
VQSTLFVIPERLAGYPVFGPASWLLAAWIVFSAGLLFWLWQRPGGSREAAGLVPFLLIVGAVIALVLPRMVVSDVPGQPAGVPIRGFGVMMMLATVAAVGLAAYRAWQVGIDPETIYALSFWMFIAGIIGARLFFIVQYWGEFRRLTPSGSLDLAATFWAALDMTKGGLVVYGSVLAGLPAGAWYCWRRGLPLLVIADIIAPSMVVGQALGRIGCFLNGCCFGGVCLAGGWGVTFPAESPPYKQHLESGWHSGIWLQEKAGKVVVAYVAPQSRAAASGIKPGDELEAVNRMAVQDLKSARAALLSSSSSTAVRTTDGRVLWWQLPPLPERTVPVHPTQLYSAIDAGLLALVLWLAYPFRRKDGEIFALLITIHPITRILLEAIRSDEPGRFGTALTISQWISLGILAAAAVLWWYVEADSKNRRTKEPNATEAA